MADPNFIDAMDKVEAWITPTAGGAPPAPDFHTRCAIRKIMRVAKAADPVLSDLEKKVSEAHKAIFNA